MNSTANSKLHLIILLFLVVIGFIAFAMLTPTLFPSELSSAISSRIFVQDEPDMVVMPEVLERISWSGVLAGSFLSLIIMFLLNLLGTALGLSQVNPEDRHASTDTGAIATGTIIWIAISNLLALFIGGWVAAYFAGIPAGLDGFLHGLMVWAVTGLVSIILVMTGVGKIMNGLATLVSSGMSLTGSLAGGAAHVTSGAVQTAGGVIGTAGHVTGQAMSLLGNTLQGSAHLIGNSFAQLSDNAIENMPMVQDALAYQNLTLEDIRAQASKLLRQAGESPETMQGELQAGVDDVTSGIKQAIRNPQDISRIFDITLNRVLTRGEAVMNEVDRDSLVNLMSENGNMSREEAMAQLERWEEQFSQVRMQTQQAREAAMQKMQELRMQAEQKAQEMYDAAQVRIEEMQKDVENRLNQAKEEAEHAAREAAQMAKETFTRVATAVTVAMIIGAIAAGLGGYFGTPENLPEMEIENEANGVFYPRTDNAADITYVAFDGD